MYAKSEVMARNRGTFPVRNLTRMLTRILILLLGELLVLLTLIELLTNHGSGTRVQGMATAANIAKSEEKRY